MGSMPQLRRSQSTSLGFAVGAGSIFGSDPKILDEVVWRVTRVVISLGDGAQSHWGGLGNHCPSELSPHPLTPISH